jgi:aryl-alcohol dehydrogenase-like predicted oxidoreductase
VHLSDEITRVEEVMRGLGDLVRHGKVLYSGISDAPAVDGAGKYPGGASMFDTLHRVADRVTALMERTVERELIPMAKALNLGSGLVSPGAWRVEREVSR